MSKKDTSKNKKESTKDQENSNKEAVASVPLEDYEKIKDDYLRLAADFDNFKKRIEKEKEQQLLGTISLVLAGLFPLIDNLEIAMNQEKTPKEIEALHKLVTAFLEGLSISEVPGTGENFDPTHHEAIEHTGEGEKEIVKEVLRKGYKIQDKLIRPAMVKVSRE